MILETESHKMFLEGDAIPSYCIILSVVIEFWKFLEFYKTTTEDDMSHIFVSKENHITVEKFIGLPDEDKEHLTGCSECSLKLSEKAKEQLRIWVNGGRTPNQPDAI